MEDVMLVEPKDMLKALNQFDFVNLRHLTTRRDNGYIRPVAGVNKGERPKYDMRNALIYCVGAFLESNSFLMAEAYRLATYPFCSPRTIRQHDSAGRRHTQESRADAKLGRRPGEYVG